MFEAANATVMVRDIDRSLAFYTGMLGLPAGVRHGNNYAEAIAPGVTIGLHPKRENDSSIPGAGNLSIGLQVADMAAATKSLGARGVKFKLQENATNKFAFFSDPDGTPLYLVQPKKR